METASVPATNQARGSGRRPRNGQALGLLGVILLLGIVLAIAGRRFDADANEHYNIFLNANTLFDIATDTSLFAIMAVGACMVIISGGIDLSVGSVYALSGVTMAMVLRACGPMSDGGTVLLGLVVCLGVGLACGLLNGGMVVGLQVHPFIITLGMMWILRGIAFVSSGGRSIGVPQSLINVAKYAPFAESSTLYPVPGLVMVAVVVIGAIYLSRTVMGRHIYAVGGNVEASRYSGLRVGRVLIGVYALAGLAAGLASFVGSAYYGSASCNDATGYELYVIASAVVGGTSLVGGKGSAVNVMLGALLIILIRRSITTLGFDQNYEWIIVGCAIIVAVVLDRLGARLTAKQLAR
jgi:ribose/xylose/arabinose/galactoside ABC-type transport system permease subunit